MRAFDFIMSVIAGFCLGMVVTAWMAAANQEPQPLIHFPPASVMVNISNPVAPKPKWYIPVNPTFVCGDSECDLHGIAGETFTVDQLRDRANIFMLSAPERQHTGDIVRDESGLHVLTPPKGRWHCQPIELKGVKFDFCQEY